MINDVLINKLYFEPDYLEELDLNDYRKQKLMEEIIQEIVKEENEKNLVHQFWIENNRQELINEVGFVNLKRLKQVYSTLYNFRKKNARKPSAPKTLRDIWERDNKGTDIEYHRIIEMLKNPFERTNYTFLIERGGKLYWNKTIPCRFQYLIGLTYILIDKGWIIDRFSAPQLKEILNLSFNAGMKSHTYLKSISANPPNDKYLRPFKGFPPNP